MGFFKKTRGGGKIGSYSKGGGMSGKGEALGGYSIFSHEQESKAKTDPITKKAGNNL